MAPRKKASKARGGSRVKKVVPEAEGNEEERKNRLQPFIDDFDAQVEKHILAIESEAAEAAKAIAANYDMAIAQMSKKTRQTSWMEFVFSQDPDIVAAARALPDETEQQPPIVEAEEVGVDQQQPLDDDDDDDDMDGENAVVSPPKKGRTTAADESVFDIPASPDNNLPTAVFKAPGPRGKKAVGPKVNAFQTPAVTNSSQQQRPGFNPITPRCDVQCTPLTACRNLTTNEIAFSIRGSPVTATKGRPPKDEPRAQLQLVSKQNQLVTLAGSSHTEDPLVEMDEAGMSMVKQLQKKLERIVKYNTGQHKKK